jgi:hypothetical protein
MLILNKIDQAGEMGAGRVLADLYRKRPFLGCFTSELVNLSIWPLKASQKPYRNQRPDTHHAWMGFGMCAQRAYLYPYPPPRRRSQGNLARPSQTQIGEKLPG